MTPRRCTRAAGAAALLAVALAACTSAPEGAEDGSTPADQLDLQREPRSDGDQLPAATAEELWLPYQIQQLALVTPPWPAGTAQERDGVFVAPQETDGVLEFSAVDDEGTTLWSAQRPASCTGFVLTSTSDGQDIVVLADLEEASEGLATTASAYDLHTGEQVWGPVEVPGPHRGPGLVYAEMPDTFGEPEGALALDADTGQVLPVPEQEQVIGEYGGAVLTVDDTRLTALEPAEDGLDVRWELPLGEHDWTSDDIATVAGTDAGPDVALLDVGTGGHVLLDLADGHVLAEGVRDAVTDAATGARVVLDDEGLHGIDPDGQDAWSAPAGAEAQFQAAGGALVYLLDDGAVRVHNTLTGEVATGYDSQGSGEIAIPELIAPTGAALLTAGDASMLATTRPAEGAGDEEG